MLSNIKFIAVGCNWGQLADPSPTILVKTAMVAFAALALAFYIGN
jgi:hypothetical protein